jgi:hypothetical protein
MAQLSPTPLRDAARRGGGSPLRTAIARTLSRGSDGSGARKRVTLDAPDIHAFANHLVSKTLDEVLPGRIEHGDGDGVHNVLELEHLFTDRTHVQRTRARLRTTHAAGRTICRTPARFAERPPAQAPARSWRSQTRCAGPGSDASRGQATFGRLGRAHIC